MATEVANGCIVMVDEPFSLHCLCIEKNNMLGKRHATRAKNPMKHL